MSTITVYADFTTPDAYLASRRADLLRAAGVPVDWRAVETRPELPITGRRWSVEEQDALAGRFAALTASLCPGETLPHLIPPSQPKTEAAVTAVAETYGTPVADDVRRLLMQLYWTEGGDIGSPAALRTPLAGPMLRAGSGAEPLRESGFAVSVDRGPITTAAWRRIRQWRAEWHELGAAAPLLVLVDGATLTGTDAVERLGKEVLAAGADRPPAGDPRRYPTETLRPDPHWLSWVGGRWRNAYRLTSR